MTAQISGICKLSPPGDVCNVTLFRSDIQEWTSHCEDIIDLARMNNADESLTHYNNVQVGR